MKRFEVGDAERVFQSVCEPDTWSIDYRNSSIRFAAAQRNLLGGPSRSVEGEFGAFTGFIHSVQEDFSGADISFTVLSGSINTANPRRDKHLRSAHFLGVKEFPAIHFHGISFEKNRGDTYSLEGRLTMHGVERDVLFHIAFDGTKEDSSARTIATFIGSARINRHDFGIKPSILSELFIGKEVLIRLKLQFVRMGVRIL